MAQETYPIYRKNTILTSYWCIVSPKLFYYVRRIQQERVFDFCYAGIPFGESYTLAGVMATTIEATQEEFTQTLQLHCQFYETIAQQLELKA